VGDQNGDIAEGAEEYEDRYIDEGLKRQLLIYDKRGDSK